jgi:hypothetical protein
MAQSHTARGAYIQHVQLRQQPQQQPQQQKQQQLSSDKIFAYIRLLLQASPIPERAQAAMGVVLASWTDAGALLALTSAHATAPPAAALPVLIRQELVNLVNQGLVADLLSCGLAAAVAEEQQSSTCCCPGAAAVVLCAAADALAAADQQAAAAAWAAIDSAMLAAAAATGPRAGAATGALLLAAAAHGLPAPALLAQLMATPPRCPALGWMPGAFEALLLHLVGAVVMATSDGDGDSDGDSDTRSLVVTEAAAWSMLATCARAARTRIVQPGAEAALAAAMTDAHTVCRHAAALSSSADTALRRAAVDAALELAALGPPLRGHVLALLTPVLPLLLLPPQPLAVHHPLGSQSIQHELATQQFDDDGGLLQFDAQGWRLLAEYQRTLCRSGVSELTAAVGGQLPGLAAGLASWGEACAVTMMALPSSTAVAAAAGERCCSWSVPCPCPPTTAAAVVVAALAIAPVTGRVSAASIIAGMGGARFAQQLVVHAPGLVALVLSLASRHPAQSAAAQMVAASPLTAPAALQQQERLLICNEQQLHTRSMLLMALWLLLPLLELDWSKSCATACGLHCSNTRCISLLPTALAMLVDMSCAAAGANCSSAADGPIVLLPLAADDVALAALQLVPLLLQTHKFLHRAACDSSSSSSSILARSSSSSSSKCECAGWSQLYSAVSARFMAAKGQDPIVPHARTLLAYLCRTLLDLTELQGSACRPDAVILRQSSQLLAHAEQLEASLAARKVTRSASGEELLGALCALTAALRAAQKDC